MLKRRSLRTIFLVGSVFIFPPVSLGLNPVAYAQENSPAPSINGSSPAPPADNANRPPRDAAAAPTPSTVEAGGGYLSSPEIMLTLMVIGLTLVALTMQYLLLKKTTRLKAEDTLRVFGVTLILMGTLFAITAGYSSSQIAPAVGLFGTVAGYLLGRVDRKENDETRKESESNA